MSHWRHANPGTRNRVNAASLAAALLLCAAAALLFGANRNEGAAWHWVTHTREVLERLQQVISVTRTAESAQRAYLLTGAPDYLGEMQDAQRTLPPVIDEIAALTVDNPRQQQAVPDLRRLALERLRYLGAVVQHSADGGLDTEDMLAGGAVMSALSRRVDAMMQEERNLLANRQRELARSRQLQLFTTAAVGALSLLLVAVLRSVSRRDARVIGEAAERADAVFRVAPAGLVIVDGELRVAELNEAMAAACGATGRYLVGQPLADVLPDGSGPRMAALCRDVLDTGVPRGGVEIGQSSAGVHRDWLASFQPVRADPRRPAVVVAVLEITGLKNAERRLEEANRLLESRVNERTAQLSTVNEDLQAFAHTVAHDLRAPLRNIEGFSAALAEDEGERISPDGQLYLARIQAGVGRMNQLITDLLSYSRLARGELDLEPVALSSVVAQALRDLETPIRDRAAIIEVQPRLPHVLASRPLLVQVLVNLLSNAIKFVADGVSPRVSIEAQCQGRSVQLAISDNGIGIAPPHRERVFGVFERLHGQETFPGTGIGLAIVRRAVSKMNGTVQVQDSPMGGARLTLVLPSHDC